MSDYLRSILRVKKFLKRVTKKPKGSIKEPSFCLIWLRQKLSKTRKIEQNFIKIGLVVVFLFVLTSFFGKDSFYLNKFSFIVEKQEILASSEKGNLFIGSSDGFLVESPEFLLVDGFSFKASSPPTFVSPQVLGSLGIGYQEEEYNAGQEIRTEIIEHVVQKGEALSSLAVKYDISLNTIVWANNGLSGNSALKTGQKLIILPTSGVIHHIKSGDTISGVAEKYKSKISEIVAFNELLNENDIYIGDIIIVPDGIMPAPVRQKQPAVAVSPSPSPSNAPSTAVASSYFILPISSPYIVTQGLHWHNAIDFSHQGYACGKPVFASAGGTVQRVVYGRTGYGYYVTILHPNNVVTLYAHLNSIFVSPGQTVSQGTRIGLIGNTGYTIGRTGCHLHFEVRGAANPFAR